MQKTLLSGWFLSAGAFALETTFHSTNKTDHCEGFEGYLYPKNSTSQIRPVVLQIADKKIHPGRFPTANS